jgi:hypothetical protein
MAEWDRVAERMMRVEKPTRIITKYRLGKAHDRLERLALH